MSDIRSASRQTRIDPQFLAMDGLSIRFARSEPRDEQALLLNPWPESLFAFEPTWPALAEHVQLFAVDLPGFGHSEGRMDLLSPRAMGGFVVRLADALGLEQPHAVGPDIGTNALLFAASSSPDRFLSLVVGSGAVSFPLELGEPLASWVGAPDLEPYRHADSRQIIAGALSRGAPDYDIPERIREDYVTAYEGERFAESMRYVRTYPKELALLRDKLPQVTSPTLIITGARDQAIPPSNAQFLHDRLARSKLDIIDAGHFVWEDDPTTYASLITSWWEGGYARSGL